MPEENTPARTARTIRRRRLITALIGITAGAILAGYVARTLAGSASGTVVTKHTASTSTPKHSSYYELDGDYLSFTYPDTFIARPNQEQGGATLQRNILYSNGAGILTLTVTVTSLPSGQLDDDPSYRMRTLHPETYALTPQTVQSEHVVIAKGIGSFEEVAFWPHAGKLATIALSGSTASVTATEAVYSHLLQSVTWQ